MGKNFAIAEFKVRCASAAARQSQLTRARLQAVLSVLIKNYVFEMRDGPDTKLGKHLGLSSRPKVEGEKGQELPMIVRKVE